MRIGVVYDFGINRGGGDYVMLNILEAICEAGHDVTLLTSNPSGYHEASEFFDAKIANTRVLRVMIPRFVQHPYSLALAAKRIASIEDNDLLILSDDIPKCLGNKKAMSYVHYLHATRFSFNRYNSSYADESVQDKIRWWLHERLFSLFFPKRKMSKRWLFVANSMITFEHTSKLFGLNASQITLLHPPVASAKMNRFWRNSNIEKEDLAISIGRLEKPKKHDEAIRALALTNSKFQLKIIGFTHNSIVLQELERIIKDLRLEDRVEILLNASRNVVFECLAKAKTIIHTSPYEPFGISVLEGMAVGCIPIVRKGLNGPWLEIIQEGKYGLGFQTVDELAAAFTSAIVNYQGFDTQSIATRALQFDKELFKDRFLGLLEKFGADE